MQHRCLIAAALVAIAGCVAFEPRTPAVIAADGIVGEALQVRRAAAPEQKAALARAEELMRRDATSANRLRLGTLLAVLPDPLRDSQRATEILDPLVEAGEAGFSRMATLIALQAQEQVRLARELDRTVRERDRDRAERDKREEALRQQVEALRGIERGILEREEKLRRREK
ncbi:MAG: hypothetical protein ABR570_05750 [Burkholderiales bacterium]